MFRLTSSRCVTLGGALTILLGPGLALAQAPVVQGIDIQTFKPVIDSQGMLTTATSDVLGHLDVNGNVYLNFARSPLELAQRRSGVRLEGIIDGVTTLDLSIALGLFDLFDVAVGVPLTLSQDRSGTLFADSGAITGINDLLLNAKIRILDSKDFDGFGLGAYVLTSFPTGSPAQLMGANSVTFDLVAVADYKPLDELTLAANLGVKLRAGPNAEIGQVSMSHQLLYKVGAGYKLDQIEVLRRWEVMVEYFGTADLLDLGRIRRAPMELLIGARRYTADGFVFNLGFGVGLSKGVGSPDYRVLVGLTWYPFYEEEAPCPAAALQRICEYEGEEDKDGFRDDDGCPDPDNDHDGILDVADTCPDAPEDQDGFKDDDGCPEPDNDGDGIKDLQDACPIVPEDADGKDDQDGCPEADPVRCPVCSACAPCRVEASAKVVGKKIEIIDKIYFKTASAEIDLKKSAPILNDVAGVLKANPWVLAVEVQGHTDDRGADAYNLDLSQRRAESVVAYLVLQGVDAGRLTGKGYGETTPLTSNSTEKGRSVNRRVEFVIEKTTEGDVELQQHDSQQTQPDAPR